MPNINKVIVGIFVVGCVLLFGVGLFLIGNSNQLFTKSFMAHADFAKITGIQNGGKVRVAGMDAGTVTRIDVPSRPGDKFRVYLRIVEKLHPIVRQDSIVTIQTDGLLGNKYLLVDAGTSSAALAPNNSLLGSTEPFDWGDLMDEISSAVKQVNGILAGVKDQLSETLAQVQGAVKSADVMIQGATPQVQGILTSANKISADLREIIDGVQAGKGTVGALFKDEELYAAVKRSINKTESVVDNLRATSVSAKQIVTNVEQSDIVPEIQKTVKNLQAITLQVKTAVDKFQSATEDNGVAENLQRTLADAREAMSDLSDNTEALKRNFFFRGFFNRRGFYDLGALTGPEYRSPAFAKGFKKHRVWIESADLFTKDAKGVQALSAEGKAKLDDAMTDILLFPRNGPLMIEGYAGEGNASQRYLSGRRRADRVKAYVLERFHMRAAYTGVISMSEEPTVDVTLRDGVAIVSYYK